MRAARDQADGATVVVVRPADGGLVLCNGADGCAVRTLDASTRIRRSGVVVSGVVVSVESDESWVPFASVLTAPPWLSLGPPTAA